MIKTVLDKTIEALQQKNASYKDHSSKTKYVTDAWSKTNVGLGRTLAML